MFAHRQLTLQLIRSADLRLTFSFVFYSLSLSIAYCPVYTAQTQAGVNSKGLQASPIRLCHTLLICSSKLCAGRAQWFGCWRSQWSRCRWLCTLVPSKFISKSMPPSWLLYVQMHCKTYVGRVNEIAWNSLTKIVHKIFYPVYQGINKQENKAH